MSSVPGTPEGSVSDRADSLAAADLASAVRVWTQFRGLIFERLEAVEKAVTAIQQTALTPDVRQKGALEAHRLAGSLGMFGLGAASRVAREIEQLLAENVVGAPDTPPRLAELAGALRHDLEKGPA